jgi:hypothetical protein
LKAERKTDNDLKPTGRQLFEQRQKAGNITSLILDEEDDEEESKEESKNDGDDYDEDEEEDDENMVFYDKNLYA